MGIDALRRILYAFACKNPSIGYAQSMNLITSVLLLYLAEESAFHVLCKLVEQWFPDHYTKSLVGSVLDQRVFDHLYNAGRRY